MVLAFFECRLAPWMGDQFASWHILIDTRFS